MSELSPTDAELMNYLLGRPLERESMARIAACKDCESRMRDLENRLESEAHEIQGQSAGFGLFQPSSAALTSDSRSESGPESQSPSGRSTKSRAKSSPRRKPRSNSRAG